MIELVQFPWSPFCLLQTRILEYAQVPFKTINIPSNDRSLVWRLTRRRYYQVPVLKVGKTVVFETEDYSQVIAKYLDSKLELGLFPRSTAGVQNLLWRYIESEIEGTGFRLNDIYYREVVPARDQLLFLRFKERKFGRGCLDRWREQQAQLLAELTHLLIPFEQMLADKPFLLEGRPLFVDFDLYGMLANFLYSGHYELPAPHTNLKAWYQRISHATAPSATGRI